MTAAEFKKSLANGIKIYSPILKEEVWLVQNLKEAAALPPDDIVYTAAVINYLLRTTDPKRNLVYMHRLKISGVWVMLDLWPEAPGSMIWTVLLSLLPENQWKLRDLFDTLRWNQAAKFDRQMRITAVPGKEETFAWIRQYLAQHTEAVKEAIKNTVQFFRSGSQLKKTA